MTTPPPTERHDQLTSFQACEILDTAPKLRFAAFAQLAARLAGAPIALVATTAEAGLRFEAGTGLMANEFEDAVAFAANAAMAPNWPLVVEDATVDLRFSSTRLVTGPAGVRFCAALPLLDAENGVAGVLCVFDRRRRDLSESEASLLAALAATIADGMNLRRSVLALCETALHDGVTGLANRILFEHRLASSVARAGRGDGLALIRLTIDRLQEVNEMFGHARGDELLREAARRVANGVPDEALVARTGADEFSVMLGQMTDVAGIADRLIAALAHPFAVGGQTMSVQAAAGSAVYPDDGDNPAILLQRAKATLTEARRGQGGHRRFEPAIERDNAERHGLEQDLRAAIETDGLFLYWQPIVDANTRQPVGYEALLRWERPGHGLVPPGEFIATAEACGLSGPLDAWVLKRACCEAASWPDRSLRASVNVSANRIRFGDLADSVATALEASGLAPNRLEIEVTERVLMENETAARDALQALRVLGVRVALDDFGTGFSSIGFLRTLPLDKLKLDRSFTRDLATDPRAREVARTVVKLGSVLGLIVLAEGVETEDQLSCLKVMGCDEVQGYLLGWPRPIVFKPNETAVAQRSSLRMAAN